MVKKIYSRMAIICVVFIAIYCSKTSESSKFKIISLSPAMTEILFALNADDHIVGVTTYCDYPEEAKKKYKVGDFSHPSIERIVNLKPDLVIVNLPDQMRIKRKLDELKITVFVSSPKTLNGLYREIKEIGRILKKENLATSLIDYMQSNLKPVGCERRKKVYIELSPTPIITIGSESFLNELTEMAGGRNIFSDLQKDYPVVAQEEVIKRDPEIIISFHPEKNIENRMGWRKINAIRNDKVYKNLNQDYFLRPGPRLVEGFKELKKIISDENRTLDD